MTQKPFVVGLTGGIGSGKTAVSDSLQSRGITIIDADLVAREVVAPGSEGLKQIHQHFGDDILLPDGSLNRAALREIIFQDPKQRIWLEDLLHPMIRDKVTASLAAPTSRFHVLSSPLLLETDQHTLVDYIVVVDVPEAMQIDRTRLRDNNTPGQIQAIMQAQLSRTERKSKADFLIDNSGDLAQLEGEISRLMQHVNREIKNRTHND